jgi:hypothetical protein
VYCEDYAGYLTVILLFLAFRSCSAYFIYLVSCSIGHFSNKCPHKKKRNDEVYSKGKQTYKGKITTMKVFKKSLCTKENISSSDEGEVIDNETRRVLFMVVKDSNKEDSEEEYEEAEEEIEEAEVDF